MLMINPQSCTATISLIVTMPVSTSTETSAICAPPTPWLINPAFWLSAATALPRLVIGFGPSNAQAFFQDILLSGWPACWMNPFFASNESASAFNRGAAACSSALSASVAALRDDTEIPPIVVLPPEAPEGG